MPLTMRHVIYKIMLVDDTRVEDKLASPEAPPIVLLPLRTLKRPFPQKQFYILAMLVAGITMIREEEENAEFRMSRINSGKAGKKSDIF